MPLISRFRNLFAGGAAEHELAHVQSLDKAESEQLSDVGVLRRDPADDWLLIGKLGDGAFGEVQKAQSKLDSLRLAAAKSIKLETDESVTDYLVEVEILRAVRHENIVGLYDVYWNDNCLWIYLEFCSYGALDALMVELERPLNEAAIRYVGRQLLHALAFLHDKHIIHRDIKAGNVLVTHEAGVKLADFGVSAKCRDEHERRHSFIGTPYWMAPEVLMCEASDEEYGSWADVWSLGITLIELAQMEPPHSEVSPMRVVIKIIKSSSPSLQAHAKWSQSMHAIVARCLTKLPSERPTCAALLHDAFVANADDARPLMQLLVEAYQSDVIREEIEEIDDDGKSGVSSGESASDAAASGGRPDVCLASSPVHTTAESSVTSISVDTTSKPCAPSPPSSASPSPPIDERCVSPPSLALNEEALGVLDELDQDLDDDCDTSASTSTPPTSSKPRAPSPVVRRRSPPPSVEKCLGDVLDRVADDDADTSNGSRGSPPWPAQRLGSHSPVDDHSSSSGEHSLVIGEMGATSTSSPVKSNEWRPDKEIPHGLVRRQRQSVLLAQEQNKSRPCSSSSTPPVVAKLRRCSDEPRTSMSPSMPPPSRPHKPKVVVDARLHRRSVHAIAELMQTEMQIDHHTEPRASSASGEAGMVIGHNQVRDRAKQVEDLFETQQAKHPAPSPPLKPQSSPCSKSHTDGDFQPVSAMLPVVEALDRSSKSPTSTSAIEATSFSQPAPEPVPDYGRVERSNELRGGQTESPSSTLMSKAIQQQRDRKLARTNGSHSPVAKRPAKSASRTQSTGAPQVPRAKLVPQTQEATTESTTDTSMGARSSPHRRTVTKKTRQYRDVDGKLQTTTTIHVMDEHGNVSKAKNDFDNRKAELQALKRLRREETRQNSERELVSSKRLDEQRLAYERELATLLKQYDGDVSILLRNNKKAIEELEKIQNDEIKGMKKRLQGLMHKDLKAFRDDQEQEVKTVKIEIDATVPKAHRAETRRVRLEHLAKEQGHAEVAFINELHRTNALAIARLQKKHQEKAALVEHQQLLEKHGARRGHDRYVCELEERHLHERNAAFKRRMREGFHMQRQQMVVRHAMEMEHTRKQYAELEAGLSKQIVADRKQRPRSMRSQMKTRTLMFKESLLINTAARTDNATMLRDIKQFETYEKKRLERELVELESKQVKRLDELKRRHTAAIVELEEIQCEKRKLMIETESLKLQQYDAEFSAVLASFHEQLGPRQTALEREFVDELNDQAQFYDQHTQQHLHASMGMSSGSRLVGGIAHNNGGDVR